MCIEKQPENHQPLTVERIQVFEIIVNYIQLTAESGPADSGSVLRLVKDRQAIGNAILVTSPLPSRDPFPPGQRSLGSQRLPLYSAAIVQPSAIEHP